MTDFELLQRYKKLQESSYLGELLDRYSMMVYGVSLKYLKDEEQAKDAVQQIFLKVIDVIQEQTITYFKSWLFIVTKNYCFMQLRKKNNNFPIDEQFTIATETTDTEEHHQKEKQISLLEKGIENLSPEQKVCIELFYYQKKSYQTIAAETGYSLLQVKSYIQNGKRNLKRWLENG
ncbi:RNA polymerase sigma factor [Gynurincola endophyticus]|uniref:RNA polymerase sigma factor n=1 Tax=Gynurincola endophyticus TaxID=2479004 RepID=UPI00131562F0|nr:sigma-70 family RNA polymerase sigma factor [Gynurincola endophyticus]